MRELNSRKATRLKTHDYSEAGYYFITMCVKDKHEMLGTVVGSDDLGAPLIRLSEYGAIAAEYISQIEFHYDVSVDKYVIMPNHIHMLIQIKNGVPGSSRPTMLIPAIIAALKKMVTKRIGFDMWQGSYHDHIIRNETEYQRIWKYIDENPLNWKEDCYFNAQHSSSAKSR
ncbi:MAG: transposase [Oscillospiraceae bacterium]|jgi:REP element-mobilizing transposase RayT|nr:transposase [Oscillospiraceae bacterium]